MSAIGENLFFRETDAQMAARTSSMLNVGGEETQPISNGTANHAEDVKYEYPEKPWHKAGKSSTFNPWLSAVCSLLFVDQWTRARLCGPLSPSMITHSTSYCLLVRRAMICAEIYHRRRSEGLYSFGNSVSTSDVDAFCDTP